MTDKNSNEKTRRIIQITIILIFAVICIAATVILFPKVAELSDASKRAEFEQWINSLGAGGLAIMLLLQIAQVIFAVIPGEPIEIIMGVLYGAWGGTAVCLIGVITGTLIVFLCVKKFGHDFVDKFMDSRVFDKLKFLHNPAKRDVLIGLLFFIPGTPKDILTYFAPFTGISLRRMLVISTFARIPSVISSTYIGSTILEGNILFTVSIFAVVGILSIIGILIYNKVIDKNNKANKTNNNETSTQNDRKQHYITK